ncbi:MITOCHONDRIAL GTPASE 2(YEAST)/OBG-RELATED, putative [Babesia bigemina]|uniref:MITOCHONDRIAL GTPASE 2(YEAST)/OBG-RELATED, putative n=1 Tax=Babesia bigemina TaxID=5866 RepID=A0A061D6W2_BABBI|nr:MITOCHONDRIAL GTPASE 2(YEAST)/OBG-RELATED, putative [Babesia bigemina]CDR96273.1 MITOCHONDRIAL GTPASE 2(YEAST)/OBG-RELATED, putative [Babesia bigemina]|eukprot:XP_012768459.1 MITOCHONDRIAL GTPASE 2(YEAST)/OBG-RELATED, putative [Babesia bigemina]
MNQLVRACRPKIRCEERLFSKPIVDIKRIKCSGGRGGDGAIVFSKHGPHRLVGPGLPIGGAGGKGGDVYIAPMNKQDNLADLSHIPGFVRAQNGSLGESRASGKPGSDALIKVPLGTLVYELDCPPDFEPGKGWRHECDGWKRRLITDINEPSHEKILLARGGSGGRGNTMRTPYEAQYGSSPQEAYYEIELKSIADIGLVGLPNVGKSTLLSAMTRANSRIAAYPFTTLAPHIGHVKYTDGASVSVADLPGIVECRITQDFFRHIERTKALLYVIDVCNTTHSSMQDSFESLREQVEAHGTGLADKPYAIVATKMDINADDAAKSVDALFWHLKAKGIRSMVLPTSAKFGLGIPNLVRAVRCLVEKFAQEIAGRVNDDDDSPPPTQPRE